MKKVLYTLLAIFTLVLVSLTSFNKVYAFNQENKDYSYFYNLNGNVFVFNQNMRYKIIYNDGDYEVYLEDKEVWVFYDIDDEDEVVSFHIHSGDQLVFFNIEEDYSGRFYEEYFLEYNEAIFYEIVLSESQVTVEPSDNSFFLLNDDYYLEFMIVSEEALDPTNPSDWDVYYINPNPDEPVTFNIFEDYDYYLTDNWLSLVDTIYIDLYNYNDYYLKLDEFDYNLAKEGNIHRFVDRDNGLNLFKYNLSTQEIQSDYLPFTKFTIKFKEGGGLRPVFDGNEHFVTNVDDPDDVNYFVSFIRAIDDFDGDISDQIEIQSDDYTPNKRTLGEYDVTLYVEDSAGNSSTFTFIVHVVDVTPPSVVIPEEPFKVSYNKSFNFNLLFTELLNVSDNYDDNLELNYMIFINEYEGNKTIIGIYDVVIVISDLSDNETTVPIQIQVIDGVGPVINGVTEIIKSDNRIMTTVEILEGITAYDEIDGDVTDSIEIISDTYTGNAHIPNKNNTWYEVKIQAQDLSGNKTTKIIKIKVIDDTSPDWYITNGVTINLSPDTELTRSQILNLLAKAGKVSISNNSRVTYTTDSYTGNEGVEGTYVLAFTIQEPNGNQSEYLYGVNVLSAGEEDDDNDFDEYEDNSLGTKIKEFYEKHRSKIITFTLVIGSIVLVLVLLPNKRKSRR